MHKTRNDRLGQASPESILRMDQAPDRSCRECEGNEKIPWQNLMPVNVKEEIEPAVKSPVTPFPNPSSPAMPHPQQPQLKCQGLLSLMPWSCWEESLHTCTSLSTGQHHGSRLMNAQQCSFYTQTQWWKQADVCGGMGKTCRLREKTELGVPRNIRVVSIGKAKFNS